VLWKDGTLTAGWRLGRGALLVPRHEVHGHLHVAMSEGAGTSRPASRRWYVRWWGFCRRRAEARKERI
jgi:hypothetical protein